MTVARGVRDSVPASPSTDPAVPARRAGALGPLRTRAYLRLWLCSSVLFLGVMAQSIARGWLAYELTGSNAALGGVLLSFGLTVVIATPFAGVVADRWPKRRVLQCSVALLGATSAWIGAAVALDVVAYWMLLVAGVLQALAFAFYAPARAAMVTELVPSDDVPDAIALLLVSSEASRIAGPAAAGALIGAFAAGLELVFFACAALCVGGLLAGIGLPPGRRAEGVPSRSPLREMRDGVGYVARRRDLTVLLLCSVGVVMVGLPYMAFLPAVAEDLLGVGSAGYGVLTATSAAGAVAAGLLVARLRRRLGPWPLVVASGVVFGLGVLALGVAPSFLVAVAVMVPLGAGSLVFQTATQSLLLTLSDMTLHGRIQSLVMLSFGAFGVVALPLGLLADAVGLRQTLVGMGLGVLLVLVGFLLVSRRYWALTRLLDVG